MQMVDSSKVLIRYLTRRMGALRPMVIADVGANPLGKPIYGALLRAGMAQVWAFEPNAEARARLMAEASDAITIRPFAVGDGQAATFYTYPASEMSSLYPLSAKALGFLGHFRRHLGTETPQPIITRRLDDISGLPDLDFLKMDAQGAECAVLSGGQNRLSKAVAVVVEMRFYRLYDGEPALWELDRALRAQGFELHRFLHQKSRMLGHSQRARVKPDLLASQLIDGDAVYIRSLEDRSAWSDEALCHLALLAAGVFGSHDLALLCLDTLAERGQVSRKLAEGYVDLLPAELRA